MDYSLSNISFAEDPNSAFYNDASNNYLQSNYLSSTKKTTLPIQNVSTQEKAILSSPEFKNTTADESNGDFSTQNTDKDSQNENQEFAITYLQEKPSEKYTKYQGLLEESGIPTSAQEPDIFGESTCDAQGVQNLSGVHNLNGEYFDNEACLRKSLLESLSPDMVNTPHFKVFVDENIYQIKNEIYKYGGLEEVKILDFLMRLCIQEINPMTMQYHIVRQDIKILMEVLVSNSIRFKAPINLGSYFETDNRSDFIEALLQKYDQLSQVPFQHIVDPSYFHALSFMAQMTLEFSEKLLHYSDDCINYELMEIVRSHNFATLAEDYAWQFSDEVHKNYISNQTLRKIQNMCSKIARNCTNASYSEMMKFMNNIQEFDHIEWGKQDFFIWKETRMYVRMNKAVEEEGVEEKKDPYYIIGMIEKLPYKDGNVDEIVLESKRNELLKMYFNIEGGYSYFIPGTQWDDDIEESNQRWNEHFDYIDEGVRLCYQSQPHYNLVRDEVKLEDRFNIKYAREGLLFKDREN